MREQPRAHAPQTIPRRRRPPNSPLSLSPVRLLTPKLPSSPPPPVRQHVDRLASGRRRRPADGRQVGAHRGANGLPVQPRGRRYQDAPPDRAADAVPSGARESKMLPPGRGRRAESQPCRSPGVYSKREPGERRSQHSPAFSQLAHLRWCQSSHCSQMAHLRWCQSSHCSQLAHSDGARAATFLSITDSLSLSNDTFLSISRFCF